MILTYKYRLKDRSARKTLVAYSYGVNQVWNYLNARQKDIEARYHAGAPKRNWETTFDLQKTVKGAGAEFGIHQQSVGGVCRQFAFSRDRNKGSLRFRSSFGVKRALGWVPFERQSRQVNGNGVTYLGKTYRFFGSKRRPLPQNAKGGAFVENALGRWWVCFHVEVELRLKPRSTRSRCKSLRAATSARGAPIFMPAQTAESNIQAASTIITPGATST